MPTAVASVPAPASRADDVDEGLGLLSTGPNTGKGRRDPLWKLCLSFFVFGLINDVLYVIILAAALDLVPPSTPKGVVLFFDITPSLVAKLAWPYVSKGKIQYAKRLIGCCLMTSCGMIVVSAFDSLAMRMLGICIASFSSGLGELTFLQLSTTYAPASVAGHSVSYFASGTGAAGLVGAFMWWQVRSLGVRLGIGLSSILPFVTPLTYYFLLPSKGAFFPLGAFEFNDSNEPPVSDYTLIPAEEPVEEDEEDLRPLKGVSLTRADKWHLLQPLLLKYMLPLFCVYLFEYTINQGIAPTLLYPLPTREGHPLLSKIIHSLHDYYPFWQLVYQMTVFFSRSWILIGLPPIPKTLLGFPAIIQAIILIILAFESAVGIFSDDRNGTKIALAFVLISVEGICGGSAYVNIFYHVNQEDSDPTTRDPERAKQEKEFKIGATGFAESFGVLLASLVAMPVELELCKAQVQRGKLLCRSIDDTRG